MRAFLTGCLLLLLAASPGGAALQFPALTGRVVDEAGVLSPKETQTLDTALQDLEARTQHQLVVATLRSLQGDTIEDYGYQLGRAWGIGQKGKNNGVLFLVAPSEHKVRIEVGYGLEGVLTDAAASLIIQDSVLPAFRGGHIAQGILQGAHALMGALGGAARPVPSDHAAPQPTGGGTPLMGWVIAILFFWFAFKHPLLASLWLTSVSRMGSSRLSEGEDAQEFRGGGGSFGGGGAGGAW